MITNKNKQEINNDNVRYVLVSPDNLKKSELNDDEIDLAQLWKVIWKGKWFIFVFTVVCAVVAVIYAKSLPDIYKSEALVAPASDEQQGGLSALSGQFGGLASLAGINLGFGGAVDKKRMAIEILKSRDFISSFIQQRNILPVLMAVKSWDNISNKLVLDEKLYSESDNVWIREAKPPQQTVPSMQEATIQFNRIFNITEAKDSGMVTISIEHVSPFVAKQWVDWIIQDINNVMKSRDKLEAERSIAYLQSQIEKTAIVEHKTLLYQLIEEQAKTLMFAEVRDEYVFSTIDPALVPELKDKPKRALIVIIAVILGAMLGLFLVLIKSFFSNQKISS